MSHSKIDELLSDRVKFNNFVYTSESDAITELKNRWSKDDIQIDIPIPDICKNGFIAFLYVAVITPNQEIIKYIGDSKKLGLTPIIFEQLNDKYTPNNEWKRMLGKMSFCSGYGKKGGLKCERLKVIDFNISNGHNLQSVKTLWGQSLVEFHHELFFNAFPHLSEHNIFDASDWFKNNGFTPRKYYESFLTLLIKHGVQFENFYLDEKENFFTREIFLPAFISVMERTGYKPLIISLEPIESEGDEYWYSHPIETKKTVDSKLN